MAKYDFDLFTIGAGSGGVAGSRRAGSYGARSRICEDSRVGGTCVIRGCVPKKLLVYGAQFADAFDDAAGFGWTRGAAGPRLGAADRRQEPRDRPARRHLPQAPGRLRREAVRGRAAARRSAYGRGRRQARTPPSNIMIATGAPSGDAGDSRHRARHHLERGARSCRAAAPHRHRRRRLYRGRVRRHLRRRSAPR